MKPAVHQAHLVANAIDKPAHMLKVGLWAQTAPPLISIKSSCSSATAVSRLTFEIKTT